MDLEIKEGDAHQTSICLSYTSPELKQVDGVKNYYIYKSLHNLVLIVLIVKGYCYI